MNRIKIFIILSFIVTCSLAATKINLEQASLKEISEFFPKPGLRAANDINGLVTQSTHTDMNNQTHIRVKQFYQGVPVWGGDAIIHIPYQNRKHINLIVLPHTANNAAIKMTGHLYKDLIKDLKPISMEKLAVLKRAALDQALSITKLNKATVQSSINLIIFVDETQIAHWAFHVNLYARQDGIPTAPQFILDAYNLNVYQSWNEVNFFKTVRVGGVGGNFKTGQLIYDGLVEHLPFLLMTRDEKDGVCYFANADVAVFDFRDNQLAKFRCTERSLAYPNLYWSAGNDYINGSYSPNNDALYTGKIIKSLYQDWFNEPVLRKNDEPMQLKMVTHVTFYDGDAENAAWDPIEQKMFFGDGKNTFYPLTSLNIAAHEISHGFTGQHAGLLYFNQSGAINESFSDMAGQAALFYAVGKNTWEIGGDVIKEKNAALRYLDNPEKDCQGKPPGNKCSIAHVKDYRQNMNVHFSSGVYNKVFYILSTQLNWDVKKAFSIMVKANMDYWTPNSDFEEAGCGIMHAASDFQYDVNTVAFALHSVGINTTNCQM